MPAEWPKLLIVIGLGLAAAGVFALLFSRATGLELGRLPLDVRIEREGFSFYFPLGTCLLISAVLTLIAWLFSGLK